MPYRCGGHAFPHDREGTVRNLFAPRRHLGPRGHHRQRPSASFPERTFHIPFFPTQRLHRPHHFILLVRGVAPPSALPHRRDTDRPLSRQQQHHHTPSTTAIATTITTSTTSTSTANCTNNNINNNNNAGTNTNNLRCLKWQSMEQWQSSWRKSIKGSSRARRADAAGARAPRLRLVPA